MTTDPACAAPEEGAEFGKQLEEPLKKFEMVAESSRTQVERTKPDGAKKILFAHRFTLACNRNCNTSSDCSFAATTTTCVFHPTGVDKPMTWIFMIMKTQLFN